MSERSFVVSIEAWGTGAKTIPDDTLSELAPTLARLGASGAAAAAGGLAGGPSATFSVTVLANTIDRETVSELTARAVTWFERACSMLGIEHDGIARVDLVEERYADLELEREPERYAGVTEVARFLGVSRQRVAELRAREDFPVPVAELAAGPVWTESSLRRFIDAWPRRPGRPRRATAYSQLPAPRPVP
jgi:hypothetical protein